MADETPFHLQGNFAPVKPELTETNLEVEGSIPPELSGLYVRNGSNPISGVSEHWFLGNGMVHGVKLEGGNAAWYRNRYVRTPNLENPELPRISDTGQINYQIASANTHVPSATCAVRKPTDPRCMKTANPNTTCSSTHPRSGIASRVTTGARCRTAPALPAAQPVTTTRPSAMNMCAKTA